MKKLTLLLIALMATTFSVQAQKSTIKKAVYATADGLCDCVNKTYGFMDEDIRDVMMTMMTFETETEQGEYIMGLDEDTQMRLMDQAVKMQDDATTESFEKCSDRIRMEIEAVAADDPNAEVSEDAFMGMVLTELDRRLECRFATFLMRIGMAQDLEDDTDNSGQIKEKTNSNNSKKSDENSGDERYGSGGN